jgi:chromosome segregation ATPase
MATMPQMELKDRLQSVTRKVEALRQRYLALLEQKRVMERKIESQELEIAKLEKEVNQLRIDNEFLRVARSIPSNPEAVARYKGQVAKMVRDIDRCIKQLNA